jgi:molybdopterin synthase sulfur carrier subunit
MARVSFTGNVQRHVPCPTVEVDGTTVRAALEAAFDGNPRARGYFLDEQGLLHQHVVVFLDGKPAIDRRELSDAVGPASEIHVMQALSGG